MPLDEKSLKFLLQQNTTTIQSFVKVLFDELKTEVKDLREENENLRTVNSELRRSLEFTQGTMV